MTGLDRPEHAPDRGVRDVDFPWVIFPLIGWGIGLTFHYIYGYRRASDEAQMPASRRSRAYAERTKELV